MSDADIWQSVPEPQEQQNFIVDPLKDNAFTVVVDKVVADLEVIEELYMIGGVWRITVEDQDDDEDVPSLLLNVVVDRRFTPDDVQKAVIKLLENLYQFDRS